MKGTSLECAWLRWQQPRHERADTHFLPSLTDLEWYTAQISLPISCHQWTSIRLNTVRVYCMLPPSVFSRKKTNVMRYKTTINEPYFKFLETPLLADMRRCQRKKASTLRQLIDTALLHFEVRKFWPERQKDAHLVNCMHKKKNSISQKIDDKYTSQDGWIVNCWWRW